MKKYENSCLYNTFLSYYIIKIYAYVISYSFKTFVFISFTTSFVGGILWWIHRNNLFQIMQHGQLRNLRTLEDFKNKQQKLMKVMFFDMLKVYIFWQLTQYTIHSGKTQILKISLRTKWTLQKKHSLFFRELQLTTVLLLICYSYTSWST